MCVKKLGNKSLFNMVTTISHNKHETILIKFRMQKDKTTAENAVCDDSWWVNFVRNDTACTKEACFLFGKCVQVTEKKVGL